jgi:hypothetical protein
LKTQREKKRERDSEGERREEEPEVERGGLGVGRGREGRRSGQDEGRAEKKPHAQVSLRMCLKNIQCRCCRGHALNLRLRVSATVTGAS